MVLILGFAGVQKKDLIIVLVLVAIGAFALYQGHRQPASTISPSPAANNLQTGPFELAGIGIGDSRVQVVEKLGKSDRPNPSPHTLEYWRDGAYLKVDLVEDQVVLLFGRGRWMFTKDGSNVPGWLSSVQSVERALGAADAKSPTSLTYANGPGKLELEILNGKVDKILIGDADAQVPTIPERP